MACNTIHLFHGKLQKEVRAPILDLRVAVNKSLERRGVRNALIIGTPNTVKRKLYGFGGRLIEPDAEETERLAQAILNFNRGVDKEAQVEITRTICRRHLDNGAEAVLLACTEFAVMLDGEPQTISTIDVLVDAVMEKFVSPTNA